MHDRVSIKLRERGEPQVVTRDRWDIVEATGEARELIRLGVLKVRRAGEAVIVEPKTLVGTFHSPTATIEISPKRPEFMAMLLRASDRWRKHASTVDQRSSGSTSTAVSLGRKFREVLLDLTSEGPPWRYSRAVVTTSMPKGRVLFGETIVKLHTRGISHSVVVSKQERHADAHLSTVLQTVLRAIEAVEPVDPRDRSDSIRLISLLGQVSELMPRIEARRILAELGQEFPDRQALQLAIKFCLAVLSESKPFRISQRIGTGVAEFVDMERLWEDAIALVAKEHSPSSALDFMQHPLRASTITLMDDGGPKLDPDLVGYDGSSSPVVIDAKYSLANAAAADDVYQITGYVDRMKASVGVLAYVAPGDHSVVQLIGTLKGGAKIVFWSLAADVLDAPHGAMRDVLFGLKS